MKGFEKDRTKFESSSNYEIKPKTEADAKVRLDEKQHTTYQHD